MSSAIACPKAPSNKSAWYSKASRKAALSRAPITRLPAHGQVPSTERRAQARRTRTATRPSPSTTSPIRRELALPDPQRLHELRLVASDLLDELLSVLAADVDVAERERRREGSRRRQAVTAALWTSNAVSCGGVGKPP